MTTGYWPQYRNELGTLVGLFFFLLFEHTDLFGSFGKLLCQSANRPFCLAEIPEFRII